MASKLDLPDDLVGYFSLFLVRETKDGAFSCEYSMLESHEGCTGTSALYPALAQELCTWTPWPCPGCGDLVGSPGLPWLAGVQWAPAALSCC